MESSTAAAGAQWATSESSVAAVWSALQYKSGSFEISERERERNFYSYWVGQFRARHSLNTKVPNWALGVGKGGGEGVGSAPTPPHKSTCPIGHLGWGREGGGGGVCPTPPHKPRCLIVKENTF